MNRYSMKKHFIQLFSAWLMCCAPLMADAQAIDLGRQPLPLLHQRHTNHVERGAGQHIEPIIGAIDNFLHNRRLGYMFEARCGNGALVVSSINLNAGFPEIRSLLNGVLSYMNSTAFAPTARISKGTLESLTTTSGSQSTTTATSIYE